MRKVKKKDKVFEIKFNSEKEKIFIFIKPAHREWIADLGKIIAKQQDKKIWILPDWIISSIKVIKDVKKDRKIFKGKEKK